MNQEMPGVNDVNAFMPKIVVFEPASLEYPLGEKIYSYFKHKPVEVLKEQSLMWDSLTVVIRRYFPQAAVEYFT